MDQPTNPPRSKRDGLVLQPSVSVPVFVRFRESHHAIARWFAQGCTVSKVCDLTGYSRRRLHLLLSDPTFQELVVNYHNELDDEVRKDLDVYRDLSTKNMIRAELIVQDKLDDEEEPMSAALANKISQDRADRLGYGKNSTVKHEHTFADALDRAIERSNKARVIEHKPSEVRSLPTAEQEPPASTQPSVAEPRPFPKRKLT